MTASLRGSHGLSARRARRTKSSRPKAGPNLGVFPQQKPPSVNVGTTFIRNVFFRWRRRRVFPHLFVCFAQRPLCGGMVCGLRHSLGLGLQQANRKYANISKYPNARSIDYRGLRTTTSVLPDFILCAFGTGSV